MNLLIFQERRTAGKPTQGLKHMQKTDFRTKITTEVTNAFILPRGVVKGLF